jgi:hypothetical protein
MHLVNYPRAAVNFVVTQKVMRSRMFYNWLIISVVITWNATIFCIMFVITAVMLVSLTSCGWYGWNRLKCGNFVQTSLTAMQCRFVISKICCLVLHVVKIFGKRLTVNALILRKTLQNSTVTPAAYPQALGKAFPNFLNVSR